MNRVSFVALLLLSLICAPWAAQAAPASPSCQEMCPGSSFTCTGSDSGPCCAEQVVVANNTICAHSTYCLVENYHCCGCLVVDAEKGIFECGGCPKGQQCMNEEFRNTTRVPGTGWYCASASSLHHLPFLLVAAAFVLLLSFGW